MNDFVGKKMQILVATTILEVGVDISEASLMIIEYAYASAFHSFINYGGEVGRSDIPSS